MKHLFRSALAVATLCGCSGNPFRAEATVSGDTGKYMGFPVCVEMTYQYESSLEVYRLDACSSAPVGGPFEVKLENAAIDPEKESFNGFGQVYLRGLGGEAFYGTELSREVDTDDDAATLRVNVFF